MCRLSANSRNTISGRFGLEDDERAQPFDQVDLAMPVALVVGAEGPGLARLVRDRCDISDQTADGWQRRIAQRSDSRFDRVVSSMASTRGM